MIVASSPLMAKSPLEKLPVELWCWILACLSQGDAFHVAQLSRRCFEVAVRHVWQDVPHASYIFGLLPGIMFDTNYDHETTSIFPDLNAYKLSRFIFYAPLIKHLNIFGPAYSETISKWGSLATYVQHETPGSNMPRFALNPDRPLQLLSCLLPQTTLEDLRSFATSKDISPSGYISNQLEDDSDLPVPLSALRFRQHFSSMLNLRTLIGGLSVFDAHTLTILGSLPHLHTMEIYDISRVPFMIPTVDLPDDSFPSLRKLWLAVLDLGEFEDIWSIRKLVEQPTEVKITFAGLELEGDAEILMGNICGYSPQVVNLTLEFTGCGQPLPHYLLESLEHLPSLEKLSISGARPASTGATCEILAAMCPSLRELQLPDLEVPISDLRHFAQLQRLEHLRVCADWESCSKLGDGAPEISYESYALRGLDGCWAFQGVVEPTYIKKTVQFLLAFWPELGSIRNSISDSEETMDEGTSTSHLLSECLQVERAARTATT